MNHHDAVLLSILANVVGIEAFRKVEVNLDRWSLPASPKGVHELDVDLRSVERTAALVDVVIQSHFFDCLLDRCFGILPVFVATD